MAAGTEEIIAKKCIKNNVTVSTAESCTGGLTAALLVNAAGISAVFHEGYITYSNEAKERILGVSHDTLTEYGAVSRETAYEMALGCAKAADSDYAVATTGIAGPDGGTPQKPVGLVYIGCYAMGSVYTEKCQFEGTRLQVRQAAAKRALEFLNEHIDEHIKGESGYEDNSGNCPQYAVKNGGGNGYEADHGQDQRDTV